MEQFRKDIGVLEEIIADDVREEKSQKVKQFFNGVGVKLIVLEEKSPLANRV